MLAVVKIRLYSMQATMLIDLLPTAIDPFSNSFSNYFLFEIFLFVSCSDFPLYFFLLNLVSISVSG